MIRRYLIPWQKREIEFQTTDVLVLGSGIAGLYTAIKASQSYQVIVLTKKNIEESNTEHAQGGIAVAMDKADSPSIHFQDTITAGDGLCDREAVQVLVEEGPKCVQELIDMGARFDRNGKSLAFTREGAHSRKRILHAQGDATGYEIERTLVSQVRKQPNLEVRENRFVLDILTDDTGKAVGVLALDARTGKPEGYLAGAVIVATGGLGQVYRYTTNPDVATGDGMAAAYRAGAELMDMEFVQFHPTAFLAPNAPRFLISEAVRGEGAILINRYGKRFMDKVPGRELAPRDVVARAIWQEMSESGSVYLDLRPIGKERIKERFPNIYRTCLHYGVDACETPVPIAPAVHYMMGGIRTNTYGETNVPNLFAAGECACNGVHGANRLASNSLLDGLVFGARIVARLAEKELSIPSLADVAEPSTADYSYSLSTGGDDLSDLQQQLKSIMWDKVGILRTEDGLIQALKTLDSLYGQLPPELTVSRMELENMVTLGMLIARAALRREESRGGHYRLDYPNADGQYQLRHSIQKRGNPHVGYTSVSGSR